MIRGRLAAAAFAFDILLLVSLPCVFGVRQGQEQSTDHTKAENQIGTDQNQGATSKFSDQHQGDDLLVTKAGAVSNISAQKKAQTKCCCATRGTLVLTSESESISNVRADKDPKCSNSLRFKPQDIDAKVHPGCNKKGPMSSTAVNLHALTDEISGLIQQSLAELQKQMIAVLKAQEETYGVQLDMTPVQKLKIPIKQFCDDQSDCSPKKWTCCGTGGKTGSCNPTHFYGCTGMYAPEASCP